MIEDIKFIKTEIKEGENLQDSGELSNSIMINSKKEKNIYIGIERITDNYNLGC